jgi:ketosteroid isomerase-like protein
MSRLKMMCLLATMLALSAGCFAQSPRMIAQKLADQYDQAYANQDLNRVLGFYDSSYVLTDSQGKRWAFAEWRKDLEQPLAVYRHIHMNTTAEDVQLEGGRMVVYAKSESHFEFHDKSGGWVPMISKGTVETTWERKSDQWKMVRTTSIHYDVQVDPEYVKFQNDMIRCIGGCPRN